MSGLADKMRHIDAGHGIIGQQADRLAGCQAFQRPAQPKRRHRAMMAPGVQGHVSCRQFGIGRRGIQDMAPGTGRPIAARRP